MAKLKILEFPDSKLRTVAKPVSEVTDWHRQLVSDMFETMYDYPGVGLAATQVNVHERLIVIDVSEEQNEPLVLINPEYERLGESAMNQEGCLSVPGFYEDVERSERVLLKALDENGEAYELEADGLLAICIQHECDHLDGKLFVDYLTNLKRKRIRTKLEKKHKEEAREQQNASD